VIDSDTTVNNSWKDILACILTKVISQFNQITEDVENSEKNECEVHDVVEWMIVGFSDTVTRYQR